MSNLFIRGVRVGGLNSKCLIATFFLNRLTGRPSISQWPATVSYSRDSFPHRLQRQPRSLCHQLCEYSNDLLSVSVPLFSIYHAYMGAVHVQLLISLLQLFQQMLAFDPRDRPSAFACLQHAYFQQEPL